LIPKERGVALPLLFSVAAVERKGGIHETCSGGSVLRGGGVRDAYAVQDLPASCTYNSGTACAKTYDSTSGVCRTIRFSTSAGEIQVLVCDKTDHYELYRQSYPSGIPFKACVGGGSVDPISGFSSFTSTALGSGCGGGSALLDPNSTGFASETRAANHARLLDVWWNKAEVIQHFPCTYGTCAWVPWYSVSHACGVADLQPLSKCGGSGSATLNDNCMVTDEFSQVFLATAQGTNGARVSARVRLQRQLPRAAEDVPLGHVGHAAAGDVQPRRCGRPASPVGREVVATQVQGAEGRSEAHQQHHRAGVRAAEVPTRNSTDLHR
jgi:hypothetical protein